MPSPKISSGVWQIGTAITVQNCLLLTAGGDMIDKRSLLNALAETLHFPAYFGHNWDAAWDCLSELDWEDKPARALRLDIAAESSVDEPALSAFIALLSEACEYWHEQGHTLTLLVATNRNDLPCIQRLHTWHAA